MIEDILIEVEFQTFYRGRKEWAAHIPLLSLIDMADKMKDKNGEARIRIIIR